MSDVWIVAAKRTPVGNRNGVLSHLQAWQLASPLVKAILDECQLKPETVDNVIMGNALYGGGNPARLAALHAGLHESTPALTIDSQCCSGMDAITLAAQQIRSGSTEVAVAGGLESWSRAPLRFHRLLNATPQAYDRPPFTPWPKRDPGMLEAAAELASIRQISRAAQEQYAVVSHQRAMRNRQAGLLSINGVSADEYTRDLKIRLCERLPAIKGEVPHQLTAATIASESDAAALVLLVSDKALGRLGMRGNAVRWIDGLSTGADPTQPALAPIKTAQKLLETHNIEPHQLENVQVMEAFAVQALAFIEDLDLNPEHCNTRGGALSRGHPIGASGAIEIVNAYHALQSAPSGAKTLCAIAAAGGLGSATLLESS